MPQHNPYEHEKPIYRICPSEYEPTFYVQKFDRHISGTWKTVKEFKKYDYNKAYLTSGRYHQLPQDDWVEVTKTFTSDHEAEIYIKQQMEKDKEVYEKRLARENHVKNNPIREVPPFKYLTNDWSYGTIRKIERVIKEVRHKTVY